MSQTLTIGHVVRGIVRVEEVARGARGLEHGPGPRPAEGVARKGRLPGMLGRCVRGLTGRSGGGRSGVRGAVAVAVRCVPVMRPGVPPATTSAPSAAAQGRSMHVRARRLRSVFGHRRRGNRLLRHAHPLLDLTVRLLLGRRRRLRLLGNLGMSASGDTHLLRVVQGRPGALTGLCDVSMRPAQYPRVTSA